MKRIQRRSAAFALVCAMSLIGVPGSARAEVDLWPLFDNTDDGLTVMFPFYVSEGDFLMVFPLYYRTREGRDTHLLWPMVKFSEQRLERVAPIWFSADSGSFTLFPLIHRDESGTATLIPPMYTAADGSQTTLLPVYSRSEVRRLRGEQRRLSVLWPIWSRTVDYDANGDLVARSRRALIFSDEWKRGKGRTWRVLGIAVREDVE